MKTTIIPIAAALFSAGVSAADVSEIELRRLFDPKPAELAAEASGRIYIYEGLRDIDIQRALGSDIMMCFDECTPYPSTREYATRA